MAEAIDDMRELGKDRRIDVHRRIENEGVDIRLDLAGELFEDQMLVLHFGGETGCLEQTFAIPVERALDRRESAAWQRLDIRRKPFVQKGEITVLSGSNRPLLDLLDNAVVLGMEDVVNRGQADVLIATPVTGDEMRVKEFVIIG